MRAHDSQYIEVVDPQLNSRHYADLREVLVYVLNGTHWLNALQQPMMIVVWTRSRPETAKFQYLFNIIEHAFEDYLPKWQIFVKDLDGLPETTLRWTSPSPIWQGYQSGKDIQLLGSCQRPTFRNFHPMWSYPRAAVANNTDNITLGTETTHICPDPVNAKDVLVAQCPIVVFKATTELQSLGIITSKTLLPSSDVQGESRERTYCPTTWNYAYTYDTPAQYSDLLADQGALLARECVLSVIAQMSNKDRNHPQRANAHAPSTVVSGMMISLTPVYPCKSPRQVQITDRLKFANVNGIYEFLNPILERAEGFVKVPKIRSKCAIINCKQGDHVQYKTCPEQNCEESVYMFDRRVSMIEKLDLHESPMRNARVEQFKTWYKNPWQPCWN